MHPAISVIFFTTASGAGYGLLILLALFAVSGALPADTGLGLVGLGLALGLVTLGLLSSTAHLGRPERAINAFSQWRSSWLSREGVAAVLTYVPAGLFGIGWVFMNTTEGAFALAGVAAAMLAFVTVGCTAMIYASLKPIQQWNNAFVLPSYLVFGLMTGAVLLVALTGVFGVFQQSFGWLALVMLLAGWVLKSAYWRHIDTDRPRSTMETATGLGKLGTVSMLEMPHTEENFLMQEMGYQVARKHAAKLRMIAHLTLFALPILLILVATYGGAMLGAMAGILAALSTAIGIGTERWLFFAEAKHTCMLYYGRG